jgi:hypothetical protein
MGKRARQGAAMVAVSAAALLLVSVLSLFWVLTLAAGGGAAYSARRRAQQAPAGREKCAVCDRDVDAGDEADQGGELVHADCLRTEEDE